MKILGLDPGLATLGYGLVEVEPGTSHLHLLDFGIIQTPPKTPMGDRLAILYGDLHTVISHSQPDRVSLEKFFFYRMSNTILVAQARGVILLSLQQHHLYPVEFTPAQVKQTLTGYGNADKLAVQEAVARELNLDSLPKPDDAADALALALTAHFWDTLP